MKKIIIISIGLLVAMIFASCQDTLTVGSSEKRLIDNIKPVDPPVDTKVILSADDVINQSREMYGYNQTSYEWGRAYNYKRFNISVDTATSDLNFDIDIEVESTAPDKVMSSRNDRVASLSIKIDKLTTKNISKIFNNPSNTIGLYIKNLSNSQIYYYTQNNIKVFSWGFSKNQNGDYILTIIVIDLTSMGFETFSFESTFIIKAPKKLNV